MISSYWTDASCCLISDVWELGAFSVVVFMCTYLYGMVCGVGVVVVVVLLVLLFPFWWSLLLLLLVMLLAIADGVGVGVDDGVAVGLC